MVVQFFFSVAALVGGFFRLTHGEQGETYSATFATSAGPSRSQGEARRGQGNWHYPLHLTTITLPSSLVSLPLYLASIYNTTTPLSPLNLGLEFRWRNHDSWQI